MHQVNTFPYLKKLNLLSVSRQLELFTQAFALTEETIIYKDVNSRNDIAKRIQ